MTKSHASILLLIACLIGCASAPKPESSVLLPCAQDPARHAARAAELRAIVRADQKEREGFFQAKVEDLIALTARDEARRQRVGDLR